MNNKPYLYIYCDNYNDYLEAEKQYSKDHNCLQITDQQFLYNRQPGKIIDLSQTGEQWFHLEITEHIYKFMELPDWAVFNAKPVTKVDIEYNVIDK